MINTRNWSTTITVLGVVAAITIVAAFAAAGSMPEPVVAVIRWSRIFHH